jgi:hypothetical protein
MKRILTIAAIVIVLLGLVIGAYFWWQGHNAASLTVNNTPVQNPFGSTGTPNGTGQGATVDNTQTTQPAAPAAQIAPRLVRIAAGPVAHGVVVIPVVIPGVPAVTTTASSTAPAAATTTDTEVRYIERESGNVYSYDIHSNVLTRISNRTIPGAIEASWLPSGGMSYLRFVSTDANTVQHVDTYALPSDGVGGYALPEDTTQVTTTFGSSTTSALLTIASGDNGSVATLSGPNGEKAKTLFTTILNQIKAFSTRTATYVETLPSIQMPGYAFTVDTGGNFVRFIGPLSGLSILPNHAGTQILYSYIDGSQLKLAAYTVATHTSTPLPVATLAEKCVWGPDDNSVYCGVPVSLPNATLPDDWYQGAVSFSDRIWRIDFSSRIAELVVNLPALNTNGAIDVVSLAVDPANDALSFVNKADGSVWSYDL